MSERRYTDREVARIFERATERSATEHSDRDAGGDGRGLSLVQLQDIGREVGIPEERIARAVAELGRGRGLRLGGLLGADPRQREIRSVPGRLSAPEIAAMVRVMDERVPAQGSVTEALGAVRWTSSDRFLSRQLSVEPGESDTLIRVEERYNDRVRLVTHALPALYAAMFGLAIGAEGAAWMGFLAVSVLAAAGFALGRGIWSVVAGRSAARTHELAEELAAVAGESADGGAPLPERDAAV